MFRPKTGKYLRAGSSDASVLRRVESIDVGRRLSRPDLILLGAERRTDCDVDRRSQPHRVLVAGVQADDRFRVFELTGDDVLLVRNARLVGSAKNSVGAR